MAEFKLPNIKLKADVKINGNHFLPEIVRIIDVARATAPELTDKTVWITSANDSHHMEGSLHYADRAFDIRIRNVKDGEKSINFWATKIAAALGPDYDVIREKDHIHVEYDPETRF